MKQKTIGHTLDVRQGETFLTLNFNIALGSTVLAFLNEKLNWMPGLRSLKKQNKKPAKITTTTKSFSIYPVTLDLSGLTKFQSKGPIFVL